MLLCVFESYQRNSYAKDFLCAFESESVGLILAKKSIGLTDCDSTYAFTMILILGQQPVFEPLNLPDYSEVILQSIKILSGWHGVPFMQEPLNRISQFSSKIGMTGTK